MKLLLLRIVCLAVVAVSALSCRTARHLSETQTKVVALDSLERFFHGMERKELEFSRNFGQLSDITAKVRVLSPPDSAGRQHVVAEADIVGKTETREDVSVESAKETEVADTTRRSTSVQEETAMKEEKNKDAPYWWTLAIGAVAFILLFCVWLPLQQR